MGLVEHERHGQDRIVGCQELGVCLQHVFGVWLIRRSEGCISRLTMHVGIILDLLA